MTNRLLISVATAALIAGSAAVHAQGTGGGSIGATPPTGPSSPAERGATAPEMGKSEGRNSEGSGMKASQTDEKAAPGRPQTRRAEDGAPKGAMSSDGGKAGTDLKADDNNRSHDADRKAGNDREQMNRNADKERDPANRSAQRDGDRTTTGQAGAQAKLSTEQRSRITTVIKSQRIEPQANINFSISVGTRVPRDVRFHPLPDEIVTIYPEWRGYEFFLVRDEIIVVDPRTLEIVAVLDA